MFTSPSGVSNHQLAPMCTESSAIDHLAEKMETFLSECDKNSFTYPLL